MKKFPKQYISWKRLLLVEICLILLLGCNGIQKQEEVPSIALSEVGKNLNLRVSWNTKHRQAILDRGEHRIIFEPNNTNALVDGENIPMKSPAYLKNKEVYIPFSFYERLKIFATEKNEPPEDPQLIRPSNGNEIEPTIVDESPNGEETPLTPKIPSAIPLYTPSQPVVPPAVNTTIQELTLPKELEGLGLSDFRIVLDAGHGGRDPGAIGYDSIREEKEYTLDIVLRLSRLLSKHSAKIFLTRDRDVYISKEDRIKFSEKNQADILISIHLNSATPQADGYEFWISPKTSNYNKNLRLASYLYKAYKKNTKLTDRKIRTNNFYVLSHSNIPATLVEVCFISNKKDFEWINQADSREQVAFALYEGILRYYKATFLKKK